jgi:hypothetical protein
LFSENNARENNITLLFSNTNHLTKAPGKQRKTHAFLLECVVYAHGIMRVAIVAAAVTLISTVQMMDMPVVMATLRRNALRLLTPYALKPGPASRAQ